MRSDGKTQVHAENLNSKMCMKNKINITILLIVEPTNALNNSK